MSFELLEQLESRQMMSVTLATAAVQADLIYLPTPTPLYVYGTNGADSISISQNATTGDITVNNNGVVNTYAGWLVSSVNVYGYDGNDSINASSLGHQLIAYGSYGNDFIRGGTAGDYLYGQDGNDYIDGWSGNDTVYGGIGDDTMLGYYGADVMCGEDGNDKLYGEADNDVLWGGNGDDQIKGGLGNDWVLGEAGNDRLWGDDGNDTIYGYAGNDELFGGAGADYMCGFEGNDTLVSIDNTLSDTLYGDAGYDSFWVDQDLVWSGWFPSLQSDYIADADGWEAGHSVHKVMGFSNGADRTLNGDNITDPTDSGIRSNFSSKPLFATDGPIKDDIFQGGIGDCYFVATLSATAKTNPDKIRQSVVDLGDGTYAVQYFNGGSPVFYRVDADLPTSGGNLVYAKLGHQNSLWVAIMEKAFAHHRTGANTYASLDGGWMNEVFNDLGSASTDLWSASSGVSLLSYIQGELSAGKAVTFAVLTPPPGCPCVGSHAYMVERVNYGWVFNGFAWSWQPISLVLRNPWGVDGAGNDGSNDGYVTLTPAQALGAMWSVQSAFV